ncbi:MAG: hypothetical protein J4400_02825 [Candidatus Aenigmarchaeota archaeon]|nr:hypothetical protein [Candidatus Aenigmarchaeota archaeon]
MVVPLEAVIGFAVSLVISTIIIYIVSKMFEEKEGFGTALLAAFIGAIIYAISYYFIGGLLASVVGGLGWLVAMSALYNAGLLKSLGMAVLIWVFAAAISFFLPTLTGPL